MSEKIPILFITYNRLDFTKKSLESLIKCVGDVGEIHIIDNNSKDGTKDFLKSFEHDAIKSITYNERNVGVGGAMNQFFDVIRGHYKYFAKVDNDTVVPKDWLERMINALKQNEDVDFMQSKHYFISHDSKDWNDLVKNHETRDVAGGKLIFRYSVGGSAIVGKVSKVGYLS